ncbi:MAG: polysaccharide deacetylase family protein [Hyphomicrobiales bacterium]
MSYLGPNIVKAGLRALYYSGACRLLEPFAAGKGLIFTLHRVRPAMPADFAPNRILEVTPEFLDAVIAQVRAEGLDVVSLDEAHRRLTSPAGEGRFVCFTLDDGYRDNLQHAWPVFRKHKAPFTIFIPTDFPEGKGELWWVALEQAVSRNDVIELRLGKEMIRCPSATVSEKNDAFERLYWRLRGAGEDAQRKAIRDLAGRAGIDLRAVCLDAIMTWDEIARLAKHPLVTIGAHGIAHYAFGRLSAARMRIEMEEGMRRLEKKTGLRPRHLAYPYGDAQSAGAREFDMARKLGFLTAVTTRKGVLYDSHAEHLTALPRVSLNGDYQALDITRAYLSGVPFALWNGFRQVNAA